MRKYKIQYETENMYNYCNKIVMISPAICVSGILCLNKQVGNILPKQSSEAIYRSNLPKAESFKSGFFLKYLWNYVGKHCMITYRIMSKNMECDRDKFLSEIVR